MKENRHIRCWLVAALVSGAALSVHQAHAAPVTARTLEISALTAGGSTQARPAPFSRPASRAPRLFKGFVLSQTLRDSIVALALAQLGTPYVFGGTTPKRGFDCSGLVRYVVSGVHMSLPRTARQQASIGGAIDRSRLEPGDLLAFGEGDTVSHIGIYVGNGKYVHASSVAGRVIISRLDRKKSRLIRPLQGARRLLATADAMLRNGG
jgi:cell wall-associated NlpC family hydrolase